MPESSESQSRLKSFIEHEATGGLALICAAVLAIALVNFGLADEYNTLLGERVRIGIGAIALDKSIHHFINDGLMAIFFFLVGLEIKREVTEGNLAERSQIMLPAAAALGGIIVPALLYTLVNAGEPAALPGWAIPAATDIAFALGALSLAGSRAPIALKIFVLTLATIDDLAAIVIIALFYSGGLSYLALIGALCCLAVLFAMNRMGVTRTGPYILMGLILWSFVLNSGVHATLAGVALGLLIPVRRNDGSSPVHELEEWLHPHVKFLILPLFAFANAGLPLSGFSPEGLSQGVSLGIIAGLVIGKPVGILATSAAVIACGLARLPDGARWTHLIGVSCLAGIGFTMSLFIGSLAFADPDYEAQVRAGVVAASVISMALGLTILRFADPSNHSETTSRH